MIARTEALPEPFFEDLHRELRQQVRERLERPLPEIEEAFERGEVDEDEAARRFVAILGAEGVLEAAVASDARSLCAAREEVAALSGFADTQLALQGLGTHPIRIGGTREQVESYASPAARGEKIAGFALTEPEAGSDARSIRTTARREDDHYVLSGEKTLITNAGLADFYCVVTRFEAAQEGATAVMVVEKGDPGLELLERFQVLGSHPIGSIAFRECRLPLERCVGPEGDGMRLALETLLYYRPSVGAAGIGLAARALGETCQHVQQRRQFGRELARLQMTRSKVADMRVDLECARLAVYRAAWLLDAGDRGEAAQAASSLAKLVGSEAAGRVADAAVQLRGGRGVVRGDIIERIYRDVRALRIYEGTSEIQRLILARGLLDPAGA